MYKTSVYTLVKNHKIVISLTITSSNCQCAVK